MEDILLVVHVLITIALVALILIQRSEGGGLGIGGGGGGGGMGGLMSGRGTANFLTRTTAVLAGAFMLSSLVLAFLAGGFSLAEKEGGSFMEEGQMEQPAPAQDQTGPSIPNPMHNAPTSPVAPSVPTAPGSVAPAVPDVTGTESVPSVPGGLEAPTPETPTEISPTSSNEDSEMGNPPGEIQPLIENAPSQTPALPQ